MSSLWFTKGMTPPPSPPPPLAWSSEQATVAPKG